MPVDTQAHLIFFGEHTQRAELDAKFDHPPSFLREAIELSERLSEKSLLCLPESDLREFVQPLVEYRKLMHVVSSPFEDRTLKKLLSCIDNPSAAPFFKQGSIIHKKVLREYREKSEFFEVVGTFVKSLEAFSELVPISLTIASELLMNAAFDAPLDKATGRPKYAHLSRRHDLKLEPDEAIELTLAHDEGELILTARDHFGSLTREAIVSNLHRCVQQGEDQIRSGDGGGAGVGLYLLLKLGTRLDVCIQPGTSTEVIARIKVSKRQRDYELQGKAFNLFIST